MRRAMTDLVLAPTRAYSPTAAAALRRIVWTHSLGAICKVEWKAN